MNEDKEQHHIIPDRYKVILETNHEKRRVMPNEYHNLVTEPVGRYEKNVQSSIGLAHFKGEAKDYDNRQCVDHDADDVVTPVGSTPRHRRDVDLLAKFLIARQWCAIPVVVEEDVEEKRLDVRAHSEGSLG